MWHEANHRSLI